MIESEIFSLKFAEVVHRKTREAMSADLFPLETVETGAIAHLDPIGHQWTRRLFDGDFYLSPVPKEIPLTSI